MKTAWGGGPWDWYYLLILEQAKLKEMRSYFMSSLYFDHSNDIKWIDKCIQLIDIMLENDPLDDASNTPYVNIRNMKRFYRLRKNQATQSMPSWDDVEKYVRKYPNDLRILKAENLYYEIRREYTTRWWD